MITKKLITGALKINYELTKKDYASLCVKYQNHTINEKERVLIENYCNWLNQIETEYGIIN